MMVRSSKQLICFKKCMSVFTMYGILPMILDSSTWDCVFCVTVSHYMPYNRTVSLPQSPSLCPQFAVQIISETEQTTVLKSTKELKEREKRIHISSTHQLSKSCNVIRYGSAGLTMSNISSLTSSNGTGSCP